MRRIDVMIGVFQPVHPAIVPQPTALEDRFAVVNHAAVKPIASRLDKIQDLAGNLEFDIARVPVVDSGHHCVAARRNMQANEHRPHDDVGHVVIVACNEYSCRRWIHVCLWQLR